LLDGTRRCASTTQRTRAPAEAHDASSSCRDFSYNARGGHDQRQEKQSAIDRNLRTVDSYVNDRDGTVVASGAEVRSVPEKNRT